MKNRSILACGCAANATDGDGNPSCAIHVGLCDTSIANVQPSLEGRTARCGCGRKEPSTVDLAFFEYRGEGSQAATGTCKHCAYFECAHDPAYMARMRNGKTVIEQGKCEGFEPHGSFEFDSFRCYGWD